MELLIQHLEAGRELTPQEVEMAAKGLLDGGGSDGEKARLLEALSRKGETAAEIAGFVEVFLRHAVDPEIGSLELIGPTIDVCGTGGDKLNLFNVSTTSMFVVAAAGGVVVKHGNRGITSKSGGADVLEALGIRIDLGPEGFRHCLKEAGVGFLFAPLYHPAFKAVIGVRKLLAERGVRTIFNLVGPLLNPARPDCQLTGVFHGPLCPVFSQILERLGRKSAWVVHGTTLDGRAVDEVSLLGPTQILRSGSSVAGPELRVRPEDFGLRTAELHELQGGDAAQNGEILQAILSGAESGPRRDMVLLNAGAAIACCGLVEDFAAGIERARAVIADGSALDRLQRLQKASQEAILS